MPNTSPSQAAGGEEQATGQGAGETVEVDAHDIYFEPKEVSIPADTDVTVRVPNKGVTLHNFSIDALHIDVDIAPGATEEVVINAPAGEYEFYCNVPGHKQAGMFGILTVQ
jgi:nitrite reductase (NO-forming)